MRPALGGVTGGLSGPAIRPVAVRCVWQVRQALPDVPILGMGGIRTGLDALEFVLAGANAVSVGTTVFGDPSAPIRVLDELARALAERGFERFEDAIGLAHRPPVVHAPGGARDPVGDELPTRGPPRRRLRPRTPQCRRTAPRSPSRSTPLTSRPPPGGRRPSRRTSRSSRSGSSCSAAPVPRSSRPCAVAAASSCSSTSSCTTSPTPSPGAAKAVAGSSRATSPCTPAAAPTWSRPPSRPPPT